MGSLFQILMGRPILRPLTRLIVGFLAIPLFRLFLKRVVRLQDLNRELEKDLELWFRASLVLLVATANMEEPLFGWLEPLLGTRQVERVQVAERNNPAPLLDELPETAAEAPPIGLETVDVSNIPDQLSDESERNWWWILTGFRIMVAIGAVQAMPDQELFAVIHPGPPRIQFDKGRSFLSQVLKLFIPVCKGLICRHLNQSSPVFAILAAVAPGRIGWLCYFVAIAQYLIIGLVTSRDRALDVLSEFDRQVAIRRRELIAEFEIGKEDAREPAKQIEAESPKSTSESHSSATTVEGHRREQTADGRRE